MDDEIPTGHRWKRVLTTAIEESASLLVVMSSAAAESEWVRREVGYARQLGKPILPLLYQGDVILGLASVQFEDVNTERAYAAIREQTRTWHHGMRGNPQAWRWR